MTIICSKTHAKDSNKDLISKIFEDKSISLKLKGFLLTCLSKPESWKSHTSIIYLEFKEGRNAIEAVLKEGIKSSYIQKETKGIVGKNRFTTYVIHHEKQKTNSKI